MPRVVEPSLNVTVPDPGVPPPGEFAVMVAVKVTELPFVDGFNPELTAVVVLAFEIVSVIVLDVLVVYKESPRYTALTCV